MSNFIFSINATIPIFLVILLGYFLKRIGMLDKHFVDTANSYVFKVALPVMLFKDLAFSDIISDIKGSFIAFCMIVTFLMFMVTWFLTYHFMKDKTMVGAFAQASVRSSAAILGVAFVENICGGPGMAPLMIASAVPLFNVLSVVILIFSADMGKEQTDSETASGTRVDRSELARHLKKTGIGVITNPIIIGIFVGILFAISGLTFPTIPMKVVNLISATATPVALLAIGGGFEFRVAMTRLKPAIVASVIKLLILPLVFIPVAVMMGFANTELVAILIMLASPTTVTCFIMAKAMGNDEVLTSNVVVLTTLFSSVTLTLWIYILRCLGCI